MITTVKEDFDSDDALEAASAWYQDRLLENRSRKAPYLACAEYAEGRQAMKELERLLSTAALRRVSNHKAHGTCFLVTALWSEAESLSQDLGSFRLTSFGPVPSSLKLAPGLLNHEGLTPKDDGERERLMTTHGKRMRFGNVAGLEVALSPGVLPAHDAGADGFISELVEDLMSSSMDLYANNFWSDPAMSERDGAGYLVGPASVSRGREWRRAADVVHELSTDGSQTPGDICSWGDTVFHHAGSDILMVKGERSTATMGIVATCEGSGHLSGQHQNAFTHCFLLSQTKVICSTYVSSPKHHLPSNTRA